MRFVSTRSKAPPVPFSEALLNGLAPDGGLYVPEEFPQLDPSCLESCDAFPEAAAAFLRPFLEGDCLEPQLQEMCNAAFDFPLPLRHLEEGTGLLELFHGPTAAFKDFGARFLAQCFERLAAGDPSSRGVTILVATSGDTGSAVAAAFHRKSGIRVGILFPRGAVSPRQEAQLTCWDANVRSFSVRGTFDDCQRLVKEAFRDPEWSRAERLSSANSINIGRLLPQAAYYAASAARYRRERGSDAGFVVPSGNMGNSVGAFWARRLGFAVREIALACNANRPVPDWFSGGEWKPRPSVQTLANAMDVGDPSNMERLFHLYPEGRSIRDHASAMSVDDETIRRVISAGPQRWGHVWCPHTATAVHVREQQQSDNWVIVATAHPAKFDIVVEPLVGHAVEVPEALRQLLARPTRVTEIDAELEQLRVGMGQPS